MVYGDRLKRPPYRRRLLVSPAGIHGRFRDACLSLFDQIRPAAADASSDCLISVYRRIRPSCFPRSAGPNIIHTARCARAVQPDLPVFLMVRFSAGRNLRAHRCRLHQERTYTAGPPAFGQSADTSRWWLSLRISNAVTGPVPFPLHPRPADTGRRNAASCPQSRPTAFAA